MTMVSVIIAAHNEERHIAECLDSLVNQTYPHIEIIVVDDGSTDSTADTVRQDRSVRLISQEHEGKATAVNRAAQDAIGEILMFLDGDMVFHREYVEKMVSPIVAGDCLGTCHTEEYVANPENTWSAALQAFSGRPRDRRVLVTATERRNGSPVYRAVRADVFLQAGGFSDVGYQDDQTLAPKLGSTARWVDSAICYHYNVESAGEVFSLGMWVGKTWFQRRGARALARFSPLLSAGHALVGVVGTHNVWVGLFQVVYEAGVFLGILKMTIGIDRGYGR